MTIKLSVCTRPTVSALFMMLCIAGQANSNQTQAPLSSGQSNPFGVPGQRRADASPCLPDEAPKGVWLLTEQPWQALQLKAVLGDARRRLAWVKAPQGGLVRVQVGDRIAAQSVRVTRIDPRSLQGEQSHAQTGGCAIGSELRLNMEQVSE